MTLRRLWVRTAVLAAVVLVGTLVGCGRFFPAHTAEDMARSREQVRAMAAEDLAALAEALGGTIVSGYGEYHSGGDGMVNKWQYSVRLRVEGPAPTVGQMVEAFEALGYRIVKTYDGSSEGSPGVSAERDGLSVSGSIFDSRYSLSVHGPYLTLPMEEGVPPSEKETVDVPGYGTLPLPRYGTPPSD